MKPILRTLTFAIATFSGFASLGGLVLSDLYRDTDLYKTAWQANDVITLLLLPLLLGSFSRSGNSQAARVVWLGLVAYMLYNYAFYLFGAAFNWFVLLYVLIVTSSFYTFIFALVSLRSEIEATYCHLRSRIWIAGFLLLTAVPLALVEVKQYVNFILSDNEPQVPVLVLALDLSLIVPTCILAAILLIMKQPWGYWLAGIMLVKSFAYGLVLVSGTLLIFLKSVGPLDQLLPFYVFIVLGGLVSLIALIRPQNHKLAI